jgi:hypothetical protein
MNSLCCYFPVSFDLAHLNKKLCEPWKITCAKIYVLLVSFFKFLKHSFFFKFLKHYCHNFWRQAKVITKCHNFKPRILLYDCNRNVYCRLLKKLAILSLFCWQSTRLNPFHSLYPPKLFVDINSWWMCSEMKLFYALLRVPSRFVTMIWTSKINNRHNTTICTRQKNPYI